MSRKTHATIWITSCIIGIVLLVLVRHLLLDQYIAGAFSGENTDLLSRAIQRFRDANPKFRTESYFVGRACAAMAALGLGMIAITILAVARIYRQQSAAWFQRFFFSPVHPTNLAMFRLFLFAAIIYKISADNSLLFSYLPKEFAQPTFGFKNLFHLIPISPAIVSTMWWICLVAAISGFIGLFSRASALVTTITGLYVLGVPQQFGKVNHDVHHLMWFSALMIFSRCGDMLSIDAIFHAFRRADKGNIAPPEPSAIYGFPLRIVWILIGVLYFYPGFWKLFYGGYAWIFSDNLRNFLLGTGLGKPDSFIPYRIDKIPGLTQLLALTTVLFELLFIVLIFNRITRPIIATIGFGFHCGTMLLMKVHFYSLQMCYAAFVPFDRLFSWIGRKLYPEQGYVLYDGNCKLCRRTIASLRTIDVFGGIQYINAMDAAAIAKINGPEVSSLDLMIDMHFIRGKQSWKGYHAYQQISRRIPFFWPIVPVLYLPPVVAIGKVVYRKVADSRLCSIVDRPVADATFGMQAAVKMVSPALVILSIFLIAGNNLLGMAGIVHSWPISSYPTFQTICPPIVPTMEVMTVDPDGSEKKLAVDLVAYGYGGERFWPLIGYATSDPQKLDERMTTLWKLFVAVDPALESVKHLRFYKSQRAVDPEDTRVFESELVHEWKRN